MNDQQEVIQEAEYEAAVKRISQAVAQINQSTKEIKTIDQKIKWVPISFASNPYEGSGEYKGD